MDRSRESDVEGWLRNDSMGERLSPSTEAVTDDDDHFFSVWSHGRDDVASSACGRLYVQREDLAEAVTPTPGADRMPCEECLQELARRRGA